MSRNIENKYLTESLLSQMPEELREHLIYLFSVPMPDELSVVSRDTNFLVNFICDLLYLLDVLEKDLDLSKTTVSFSPIFSLKPFFIDILKSKHYTITSSETHRIYFK